jgi:4'-phosphopantetheinyl transferase EntD
VAPVLLPRVLPTGAACCEDFSVLSDDVAPGLEPAEAVAVADAVPARQLEFGAGRWCARQALVALGRPPALILTGERGMPGWPDGVVGSITHCAGYRAAVVAPAALLPGIGVDAEPHAPLPGNVLDVVALPAELDALPPLRAVTTPDGPLHADLLLFSAKEAVYKAWFPLGRRVLAHPHVRIDADGDGGFRAELTPSAPVVPGAPTRFTGRWLVDHGLLVTLAVPD